MKACWHFGHETRCPFTRPYSSTKDCASPAFVIQSWHTILHTTLAHTIFHTPCLTHHLSHHFATHHLSHTVTDHLSHTTLSHTMFDTWSFTHHFVTPFFTHNLWHTILHTPSFTTPSFIHTTLSQTIFPPPPPLSFLPSPSPLQNLWIIIGRSWLVGLCGPLTFFSIRCSTRITDTQLSSMLQLEYFTRPVDVLHRSWTMLMLDKKTIAVCHVPSPRHLSLSRKPFNSSHETRTVSFPAIVDVVFASDIFTHLAAWRLHL